MWIIAFLTGLSTYYFLGAVVLFFQIVLTLIWAFFFLLGELATHVQEAPIRKAEEARLKKHQQLIDACIAEHYRRFPEDTGRDRNGISYEFDNL